MDLRVQTDFLDQSFGQPKIPSISSAKFTKTLKFEPDYKKIQEEKQTAHSLCSHPWFFDTFVFPGESEADKILERVGELIIKKKTPNSEDDTGYNHQNESDDEENSEKPIINDWNSRIEIQEAILKEFLGYPVHSFLLCRVSEQLDMILRFFSQTFFQKLFKKI